MPQQHLPLASRPRRRRPGPLSGLSAAAVAALSLALAGPASPAQAAGTASCRSADNGDPVLTSVELASDAAFVTTGSQGVLVTVRAHDTGGPGPASGLRSGQVTLVAPAGDGRVTAPLVTYAGTLVGSLLIPQGSVPGAWELGEVSLVDRAGNARSYTSAELTALSLDRALSVTSSADDIAPELTALSVSAGQVDTRERVRTLRVAAEASDAGSGVATLSVRASDGRHQAYALLTASRGRYEGRMTIPRWQGSATWRINRVTVTDRAGNEATLGRGDLEDAGLDRSFEVVSSIDASAPRVGAVTASASTVDVRAAGASVAFRLEAADAVAGVDAVVVRLVGPRGATEFGYLERVAGTAERGTWRGKARFGVCGVRSGAWSVFVDAYDGAGNRATSRAGTLRVVAGDRIAPGYRLAADVGASGRLDLGLRFTEPVTGLDAESATVSRSVGSGPARRLPGGWSCRDRAGAETSCVDGAVSEARYVAEGGLDAVGDYQVTLNPEGSLGATDLAGNPFHRDSRTLAADVASSLARTVTQTFVRTIGAALQPRRASPTAMG